MSLYASYEEMPEGEREAALQEVWEDAHPRCESCGIIGCGHGCCPHLDGLVMLTDGLVLHPACLAREQAADAAFGNVAYRGGSL